MKTEIREMTFGRRERRTMRVAGLIAFVAPSWAYRFILTALDEIEIPDDVKQALFDASRRRRS